MREDVADDSEEPVRDSEAEGDEPMSDGGEQESPVDANEAERQRSIDGANGVQEVASPDLMRDEAVEAAQVARRRKYRRDSGPQLGRATSL